MPSEIIIEFLRARHCVILHTRAVERYKIAGCYSCVFEIGGWWRTVCTDACVWPGVSLCVSCGGVAVCVWQGGWSQTGWCLHPQKRLSIKSYDHTYVWFAIYWAFILSGLSQLSFNQTLPQSLLKSHSSPDCYYWYKDHIIEIHTRGQNMCQFELI